MAWIMLCGLDRSGKSTIANLYKAKGYNVIHMSAPDKKYSAEGYVGPSYVDEIVDQYMKYSGQDVVFDRTPMGECVWPLVYGRKPQLTEDDIDMLREMENANNVKRYLFYDVNVEAHWKRCVDNKEPLTRSQFNNANVLFDRMATKYDFEKVQLTDFKDELAAHNVQVASPKEESSKVEAKSSKITKTAEQIKLEKANAINELLSARVLKKKGDIFDMLEEDIRVFLQDKLANIFGNKPKEKEGSSIPTNFSRDEVDILKLYCKQIIKRMENKQ